MDTCTNVPDMCRKEKHRVQGGGGLLDATRGRQRVGTKWADSERMGLFVVQDTRATAGNRGTANDLHPPAGRNTDVWSVLRHTGPNGAAHVVTAPASVPLKSVFALRSEIVDVGLEMQFEDVVLVNVFGLGGDGNRVTEQREAGQWIIILKGKNTNQRNGTQLQYNSKGFKSFN